MKLYLQNKGNLPELLNLFVCIISLVIENVNIFL